MAFDFIKSKVSITSGSVEYGPWSGNITLWTGVTNPVIVQSGSLIVRNGIIIGISNLSGSVVTF